jgi:uncharacterized protein (TIGR00106 family)
MKNIINLALQVLPKSSTMESYDLVDKAIEVIQRSGLKYRVCPFETVIEGDYESVMKVVEQAQQACFDSGADELLVYIKIQRKKDRDVFIEDKTGKYD